MNAAWCNHQGKFLNDTGYYAYAPCKRCFARALVLDDDTYLCGEHLPSHLSIPDWLNARREDGRLYP